MFFHAFDYASRSNKTYFPSNYNSSASSNKLMSTGVHVTRTWPWTVSFYPSNPIPSQHWSEHLGLLPVLPQKERKKERKVISTAIMNWQALKVSITSMMTMCYICNMQQQLTLLCFGFGIYESSYLFIWYNVVNFMESRHHRPYHHFKLDKRESLCIYQEQPTHPCTHPSSNGSTPPPLWQSSKFKPMMIKVRNPFVWWSPSKNWSNKWNFHQNVRPNEIFIFL
jgi:hypothetical protein